MNRKNIAIPLIVLAVALAGALVAYKYKHTQDSKNIVNQVSPGLNASELDQRNKNVEDITKKLEDNSLSKEARYQLELQLGDEYMNLGKLLEARAAYTEASHLIDDNSVVWGDLYRAAYAMRDYDAANKYIQKAIELNPSNGSFWVGRLNLESFNLGAKRERMDALYKEALEKTNSSPQVLTAYAQYLEQLGDKEAAIKEWEMAISVDVSQKAYYQSQIDRLKK
jgi:tetratricopeptide (TPR) repeat protein